MLERWWKNRPTEERLFEGGYVQYLGTMDDLYSGLRYLQRDLKRANPQVEILSLLSASRVALKVAKYLLRKQSPFKIETTSHTSSDSAQTRIRERFVEGVVRSVKIPDGFDPHARVESIIDTDNGEEITTDLFRKADVESYHQIECARVFIEGYSTDDQPAVLQHSRLLDRVEPQEAKPSYNHERRELFGSVYDLARYELGPGRQAVTLILDDATYFTKIACIFSTAQEQGQLAGVHLGQNILISGEVSLRNGRPIVLLAPEILDGDAQLRPSRTST